MKVVVEAFSLQKAGNADSEYEDAYWPKKRIEANNVPSFRVAVADGATETSFSGPWAQLLVRSYCRGRLLPSDLVDGLPRLEKRWKRFVGKRPLPWYAQEKVEAGAFAAIVGLEVQQEDNGWTAFAVGDCCLFHTRDGRILRSFPMDDADQFNSRPLLLSSVARRNAEAIDSARMLSGSWMSGDTFYLMSDAIAAWFLRYVRLPNNDPIVDCFRDLTAADFKKQIDTFRSDRMPDGEPWMKNDDVTLLACTVS